MISSPYAPELVTAPAAALLTRAEAKVHLRMDEADTSEDALVDGLIGAATAHLDGRAGILGRCLINQTWRVWWDRWDRCLRLPFPGVSAVTVTYENEDTGSTVTVGASNYRLLEDAIGSYVAFDDEYWPPSVNIDDRQAWGVQLVAGYGATADAVPAAIKQAALLMIGHWYANREAVNVGNITSELPLGAQALLAPYRRVGI